MVLFKSRLSVSDALQNIIPRLRVELDAEAASGFARLRRVPQTDIIWFLDYFAGLAVAEQETLLDALAESGAMAFTPLAMLKLNERGTVDVPEPLARMCEIRSRPGGMGGTRYTDLKMLSAETAMQEPGGYHESWRQHLTALHFQPRPDLMPSLDQMKPARAPLLRKLVNTALTKTLGLRKETKQGVLKYVGRCGEYEVKVWVDFGGMLSQLGYSASLKSVTGQPLALQISYERFWGTSGRWDYLTEENATRCIDFFSEQIAYLADLTQRVVVGTHL
jgi:hypothetical protein